MNQSGHARNPTKRRLNRVIGTAAGVVVAGALLGSGSAHACPKLLLSDSTEIGKQTTAESADYWGRTVGAQGFLVNHVMWDWQTDVGIDPESKLWRLTKTFQTLYSAAGATDNFLKVAIYKRHSWQDAAANTAVIANFAHAAALAKYAGFKGVALDLEPYVPIWGGEAGGPELAPIVARNAQAIGRAMRDAYPDMTLILVGDALHWGRMRQGYHGGYALALPFLQALLSARFPHVVIATELTFEKPDIENLAQQVRREYDMFAKERNVPPTDLTVAPGIWPLGASYEDKSPRIPPEEFGRRLMQAFGSARDYVWIYGFGSAWQTAGPYGAAPVTANFQAYLKEVHETVSRCRGAR